MDGKIYENLKFTPPPPPQFFPSASLPQYKKALGKKGYICFWHILLIIQAKFLNKPKFNCLTKILIFIFTANFSLTHFSKSIKIHKANFEAYCSYKDCNQCLFWYLFLWIIVCSRVSQIALKDGENRIFA